MHHTTNTHTCAHCTSYTPHPGKERLFLEVARRLGKKVYIGAAKRGVLSCLGLAPEYAALLTTNHLETNLHAASDGRGLLGEGWWCFVCR